MGRTKTGLLALVALAALTQPAQAWPGESIWRAITGLFRGGPDEVSQREAQRALRTLSTEAVIRAKARLSAPDGFSGDPELRVTLPETSRGLRGVAGLPGRPDPIDEVCEAINLASSAAAPTIASRLAEDAASFDFGDPLAVLKSEGGAAAKMLAARHGPDVAAAFEGSIDAALSASPDWAKVEAALQRAGPVRAPSASRRELVRSTAAQAADHFFLAVAREEKALRANPEPLPGDAREVLRRAATGR